LRFLRFFVGDGEMLRCPVLSSSSETRRRLCDISMFDATERYKVGLGVNMAPSQIAEKAKQNAGQAAKMNLYNHWLFVIFNYFPP